MPTDFPNALDTFVNPTDNDTLDDPAVVHTVQHANHNDSIAAIEQKLGINFSSVATSLDFIVNLLVMTQESHPTGGYRETNPPGDPFPTQVIWYKNAAKTIKLVEKLYTRNSRKVPTTITLHLYDGTVTNSLIRTITDTITYTNIFELYRTRVIS